MERRRSDDLREDCCEVMDALVELEKRIGDYLFYLMCVRLSFTIPTDQLKQKKEKLEQELILSKLASDDSWQNADSSSDE